MKTSSAHFLLASPVLLALAVLQCGGGDESSALSAGGSAAGGAGSSGAGTSGSSGSSGSGGGSVTGGSGGNAGVAGTGGAFAGGASGTGGTGAVGTGGGAGRDGGAGGTTAVDGSPVCASPAPASGDPCARPHVLCDYPQQSCLCEDDLTWRCWPFLSDSGVVARLDGSFPYVDANPTSCPAAKPSIGSSCTVEGGAPACTYDGRVACFCMDWGSGQATWSCGDVAL